MFHRIIDHTIIIASIRDEHMTDTIAADSNDNIAAGPARFQFSGTGGEYFRIWIVNLLLTIVTLGLYAPWAKVRNRQYFYGNTSLDGASFEYTADPVKLLIGRLIALAALVLYYFAGNVSPEAASLAWVLLMCAVPWALNKSLAFNARNSVHRNIRFRFVGDYGQAFIVCVLWPMAAALTLGILAPVAIQRWKRYTLAGHRYGNKSFQFGAGAGRFYRLCLFSFGIAFVGIGGAAIASAKLSPNLGIAAFIAGYGLAMVYFTTGMNNLVYNNTTLASHSFSGRFTLSGYGWIMVSNFLLIIATLGLYIPWAKVRVARYKAEHIALAVTGDLNQFAALSQEDEEALGEEFGDVFGLDFGF